MKGSDVDVTSYADIFDPYTVPKYQNPVQMIRHPHKGVMCRFAERGTRHPSVADLTKNRRPLRVHMVTKYAPGLL